MRTLNKKSNRLDLQKYSFDSLKTKGYNHEVYGDLNIFTMTDDSSTWLKIYRGTASKEIVYKRYRTEAQAVEAITNAKASHDRNKAYKAELKANPKKSSHANCAKAIREELKTAFPDVKFSVKSQSFANGDSVHIEWTDGPTDKMISEITRKYAYGRFDSMEDLSYSVHNENLPQAKFVQTRREISDEVNKVVREALTPILSDNFTDYEINQFTYRMIYKTPIPVGATVTGIQSTGDCGQIEDIYTLTMLLPESATKEPETPNFEAVPVEAGQIQIIDYSEKAIAVIGDTKPIKDKLKDLGGRWNNRLTCGAGWIFPKTKLTEIEALFN